MKKVGLYDEGFYFAIALILVIVFCFSGTIQAKVYYVSTDNIKASDNNPGTKQLPWKTIQKAANTLVAGDTVFIENGVYRESIEVKNSGTSYQNMISFIADGDSVYIKGSDIVTGWVLWKNNIWVKKNWQYNSQQVFVNGKILQQIGGNPFFSPKRLPAIGKDQSDIFPGSFYYDPKNHILYVELSDNGNPNGHIIEASDKPYLFLVQKKKFIFLDGLNFMHSNTTATYKEGWPAVNISGSNCIVQNLYISWCDFEGLGGSCDSVSVINCVCNFNGDCGMTFLGQYLLIKNCTTNYNNYRNFKIGWHSGGVKNVKMYDSVIANHTSIGNNGPGIWCDIECKNITISDCKVIGNKDHGIFYEISDKGIIKNNIVYNNAEHGIFIASSNNCGVYNNLVYGNFRGIVAAVESGRQYTLFNNTLENNIIENNEDADIVIAPDNDVSKNNHSDYNLYYNTKSITLKSGYGRAFRNINKWQDKTGNDIHSIVADPQIQITSDNHFGISDTSPAFGNGKEISGIIKDINGKVRSDQAFDIGPFAR